MLHPDGLEVVIRSVAAGNQYREYERAGDTDADNEKIVRYIEAVDDQQFMIQVNIKPYFLYFMADGVRITVEIDGGVVRDWEFISKPSVGKRKTDRVFIKAHGCERHVSGLWEKVEFIFAKLQIGTIQASTKLGSNANICFPDNHSSADAALMERLEPQIGKIVVTIQRGYCGTRSCATRKQSGRVASGAASSKFINDTKISHATK